MIPLKAKVFATSAFWGHSFVPPRPKPKPKAIEVRLRKKPTLHDINYDGAMHVVTAHTRSEARAILKKTLGLKTLRLHPTETLR